MGKVSDYISARKKKNADLRLGSLKEIAKAQSFPPISTGNVVLDYVTSVGGIPRGLVTEIRGETGSGKTTLATQAAVQHQRKVKAGEDTGAVLYLDFEYAVNDAYFENLGMDIDDDDTFVYYQPNTLEEGLQFALEMVKEGLLAMIIVDSIAAASAESEYENHIGKLSIGSKAKAINQALRMLVGPLRVQGTSLILINHTQVKIPQTFIEKKMAANGVQEKISPGGRGIEYYTSLRLDLAKPSLNRTEVHDDLTNDKTKQVTSTEVEVYAFKNKLGSPHRRGKMRVHFGRGFSQAYSAFNILVDHKIIKKKAGGHFEFPAELLVEGIKVPVGEDNVVAAVEKNSEWSSIIVKVAEELVLRQQVSPDLSEGVIVDVDGGLIDEETGEVLDDDGE